MSKQFLTNSQNNNHFFTFLVQRLTCVSTGISLRGRLVFCCNMGPRMFSLLLFVLLILGDYSQGVPDMHEKSQTAITFADVFAAEPLTGARPIGTPRQHDMQCNCAGIEGELTNAPCCCLQSAPRKRRHRKVKRPCRMEKYKNLKRCRRFSKPRKEENPLPWKFDPSIPI